MTDGPLFYELDSVLHEFIVQSGDTAGIKHTYMLNGYRLGTVNSKSFVSKVLLRIKWKFELTVFELTVPDL